MAKSAKSRFGYTFTLFVPLYLLTCFETLLMQLGFLTRTPRGRCVTRKAYEHLHMDFMGQEQLEI